MQDVECVAFTVKCTQSKREMMTVTILECMILFRNMTGMFKKASWLLEFKKNKKIKECGKIPVSVHWLQT